MIIHEKAFNAILFFIVLCFIGIKTSYEDIKTSNIRNKWILLGLIYALTVYIFSALSFSFNAFPHSEIFSTLNSYLLKYSDRWVINLLVSIALSYWLWHIHVWGAGDAKLFITFAALIPIGQYSRIYFDYYFASFYLLLAIFLPSTIFLSVKAAANLVSRMNLAEIIIVTISGIRAKFNKILGPEALKVIPGFFVFFLFFRILNSEIHSVLARSITDQNTLTLISLLAFRQLNAFFRKKLKLMAIVFMLLVCYETIKSGVFWAHLLNTLTSTISGTCIVFLLYPLCKIIEDFYEENIYKKTTPFAPWMFLGALIVWFI